MLTQVVTDANGVPGYRLKAASVGWVAGDGTKGADDPLRRRLDERSRRPGQPVLPQTCTATSPSASPGLHAKEHTAQVPPEQRELREQEFREG